MEPTNDQLKRKRKKKGMVRHKQGFDLHQYQVPSNDVNMPKEEHEPDDTDRSPLPADGSKQEQR